MVTGERIGSRSFADSETIVNVPPVIRSGIGRIDAERLDSVDGLQHAFDFLPTFDRQEDFATWPHEGRGGAALAGRDGTHDVDLRGDGSVAVARPADDRENGIRRERNTAAMTIETEARHRPAETDALLDTLGQPCQLDKSQPVRCGIGELVSEATGHH